LTKYSAQLLTLKQKHLDIIFYTFSFSGTFRWDDAKDKILLREVRVVEPYIWKGGSKQAGQGWTETAKLVNTYEGFKDMPRDQRAVRERFNKLMGEFRSKTRAELNASGISPDPPTEIEILLEEISEIMLNTVHTDKNKHEKDERAKALSVRDAAMHTWGKSKERLGSSEDESDGSSEESNKTKQTKRRKQRKRKGSGDAFEYLRMRSEQSMLVQQQEIELRKQQAMLEQQKFDAREKKQHQKQDELISQQQKMNQLLENQQKQFNLQQQQQQMQMQMQMQMQAAMLAVLEKVAK
jgi:hypothetical protein